VDRPLLSLDRDFTYSLDPSLEAGPGSLVQVPFHGKLTRGWVLAPTEDVPSRMLAVKKTVSPVRFFDERTLALARWMAERYVAPMATCLARLTPPRVASEEQPAEEADAPSFVPEKASSGVLDGYRAGDELERALGSGAGGAFVVRPAPEDEQALAVEAVGACLRGGRTAIVVVPEAEPVPATARAVADAFGESVAVLLGGSERMRYRTWLAVMRGGHRVVVGSRAAVFAPIREPLGLIWISRESHPGHREERSPAAHVRDVALARAAIEGAVCVMSALCPTGEAMASGATVVQPVRRMWPPVEVVRPGPEGRAPRLVGALKGARRAFLYAPLPGYGVARVCRSCGEPARCAVCGGTLRAKGGEVRCLVCEALGRCANCGGTTFGLARGGAERVEEWAGGVTDATVRRYEPGAGEALPAQDEAAVVVGGPEAVKDVPPPTLDLVGILDADLAARRPGLASGERSLALWMEAAGWARPNGRVIVQSSRPNDPLVQALVAGNPDRFHRFDAPRRAAAGFPVGFPVFRVAGTADLEPSLAGLRPVTLLTTDLADQRVCLVTVHPDAVPAFGRAVRELAGRGVVTRVEAEPHL
jgi:primosomal protein N' (replication factor Y)